MTDFALQHQIGGDWYKRLEIQPIEFTMRNNWDACAHSILKYVCRYPFAKGLQDVEKAIHFTQLRVELIPTVMRPLLGTQAITMHRFLEENGDTFNELQRAALSTLQNYVICSSDTACADALLMRLAAIRKSYLHPQRN